ncbi:hypothetical protein GOL97_17150 [Sinorhizobium medicae]|uniref:hypothetical protein n=1 Tax=Sinorhizobium medicae TaxID=110321 RepID=UPI000FDCCD54|nr:hypothetical protein [Sinorhizobium medicae]MDX1205057.1 hypothetical protein [Sinorhizobium medicae]RVJ67630.1 hypothetical protein CN167_30370 [Sinorhizobium medicae]RVK22185.1 hypothetical protein CN165_05265 [Sinorhizobium medicae]
MRDQYHEAIEVALNDGFAAISLPDGSRPLLERALKQRIGPATATALSIKSHREARPKTLSEKYGAGEFPHHTDFAFRPYPPRLIVLINETDEKFERPTTVTRFVDLPKELRECHAKTLWNLKTKAGSFVVGGTTAIGKHIIHRWDVEFLSPHNGVAFFAKDRISKTLPRLEKIHRWEPRSALLLDNWNATHSRGRPQLGEDDRERRLHRLEAWHHAGMDN